MNVSCWSVVAVDGFIVIQAGKDYHLSAPLMSPPLPPRSATSLALFATDYVIATRIDFDSIVSREAPPPPLSRRDFPEIAGFRGHFAMISC